MLFAAEFYRNARKNAQNYEKKQQLVSTFYRNVVDANILVGLVLARNQTCLCMEAPRAKSSMFWGMLNLTLVLGRNSFGGCCLQHETILSYVILPQIHRIVLAISSQPAMQPE
jgi:hypothetical protein